mmetsp:Transcript_34909/g.87853  ORF Transcript_34909/g.87853 Transcript_34909/m.87853 type:complete len:853 (-) Transcript_34909:259-2817(-)|eukprot:CAMPEP_0177649928 /NCGR_PEP_ID=MMETSP0447-20121125/11658_1 /TAXON_ID=0 /ORGANISM="Stygamoeba regulata, Strain BSH-02190019" /LENGTH=852 /DNA_ID=CAMNT_0019152739 /DNA_START=63 /DNA_END=2621 /DNA_ORIENTATION=-
MATPGLPKGFLHTIPEDAVPPPTKQQLKKEQDEREKHDEEDQQKASALEKAQQKSGMKGFLSSFFSKNDVRKHYTLKDTLGDGTFAVVRLGVNKKSGHKVAIKIVDKTSSGVSTQQMLDTEIAIMQKVNHPNIVRMEAMYETKSHLYLVMELVDGGALMDKILDRGYLTEREAATVIRQMLSAVDYLHSIGVIHRDLKPENVLCMKSDSDEIKDIKLTDFGLSKMLSHSSVPVRTTKSARAEPLKSVCGTPNYFAPELIRGGGYSESIDIWAVGVILYILLSGMFPYSGEVENNELYGNIVYGDYTMSDEHWDKISAGAKSLVRELLNKNPKTRCTAKKALQHPWLQQAAEKTTDVRIEGVTERLQQTVKNIREQKEEQIKKDREISEQNRQAKETHHQIYMEDAEQVVWSDERDWPALMAAAKEVLYRAGHPILSEGLTNKCLYRIKSGAVRVEKMVSENKMLRSSERQAVKLGSMGKDEEFGEISMLDPNGIVSVSIIAEDDVVVYEMHYTSVMSVLDADPKLASRFFKKLALKQAARLASSRKKMESATKDIRTTTSEGGGQQQKQKSAELQQEQHRVQMLKSFHLAADTMFLHEFPCKWKKHGLFSNNLEGTLSMTEKYLLLHSFVFAMKAKHKIFHRAIQSLEQEKTRLKLSCGAKGKEKFTMQMKTEEQATEVLRILQDLREKCMKVGDGDASASVYLGNTDMSELEISGCLTPSDWNLLVGGAKLLSLKRNEVLIAEGTESQRLFYIAHGHCRVEITRPEDDSKVVVGTISAKETLGDISFLQNSTATASVIAEVDDMSVYCIEGTHIHGLMDSVPGFAGRFYKYLATVIGLRLRQRESDFMTRL